MTKIDRNPVVSAIVVTHDCAENVIPCLRAIKENLGGVNGEILVFDNSSFDSTVSSIKSKFTDINIFLSPENVGFAAANNKMSSIARGEYILFANPDMILDKGALLSMLAVFKKYPMAGAVVARMRYPDGSFQPTCRKFPDTRNIFFSRGSVISLIKQSSNGDEHYTIGDSDQITEVPAASATCMLVDRLLFQTLGGFDERFFLFMEDTDLCLRIKQADRKVYFVPSAGGVHYWGHGSSLSPLRRKWCHHLSVWKYFLKHYPSGFSLFFLPITLLLNFFLAMVIGSRSQIPASE